MKEATGLLTGVVPPPNKHTNSREIEGTETCDVTTGLGYSTDY